jgi:hypothetical protein
MPLKLSSIDGSNPQEIRGGQLEIVPVVRQVDGAYTLITEVTWNDRGVRTLVLTATTGVQVTVIP